MINLSKRLGYSLTLGRKNRYTTPRWWLATRLKPALKLRGGGVHGFRGKVFFEKRGVPWQMIWGGLEQRREFWGGGGGRRGCVM